MVIFHRLIARFEIVRGIIKCNYLVVSMGEKGKQSYLWRGKEAGLRK